MKKGYIIMALFFLVFAGGIYGVFVQYVMPMRQELIALEEDEADIRAKIEEMRDDFSGSRPDEFIRILEEQKLPWKEAVTRRTSFFDLEEVEEVEMPPDVIPRFWYREYFPEMEESIQQLAREKGILLGRLSFGEQRPSAFGAGTNPSREEILEEVNKYNYGIEMTKFIFDANPSVVDSVTVWPMRQAYSGRSGVVNFRTTGYSIKVMWDDLVEFLQRISQRESFITVEGILITNRTLRNPNDPVDVTLIVTEAQFVPAQGMLGAGGSGNAVSGGSSLNSFGGGGLSAGSGLFGRRTPAGGDDDDDDDDDDDSGGGPIEFIKGLFGF